MALYYGGTADGSVYNDIYKDLEITAAKPKIKVTSNIYVNGGLIEFYFGVKDPAGVDLIAPVYCARATSGRGPSDFSKIFTKDDGGNFTVGQIVTIHFTKPPWYGDFFLLFSTLLLELID